MSLRSTLAACPRRTLFVVLLAALLAGGAAPGAANAQPDTTRWTPELAMQYDQITDTEISPDGKQVAYVVREAVIDKTTSEFRKHIHVASVDGSFDVQYTRGEHSNISPRWSPSGDRLAFLSTRGDGPPQVHLMRTDGGEAYAVTDIETGVSAFQWGPEGERIAYTATDPKSEEEKQREKEKRDVHRQNEEFRYDHLYVAEVKPAEDTTRTVQRLTEGAFHVTGFDWAPDGEMIAFAHRPTPRVNSFMETDLSVVPADSGAPRSLVERPGVDENPRYGPSGERVAFESMAGREAWERLSDVWTVPSEGGRPTVLAQTPNRDSWLIEWTAGGDSVLVRDYAGTSTHVYAAPVDAGSVRQITSGKGLYSVPHFGALPSYSRSADRLTFTYQNSTTPVEVYVGPRTDFERRRLTSVHAGSPRPQMGRTEQLTWTAPGGRDIEGLLTYPVGYDGGRIPLVVNVHGGPHDVTHTRVFTGGQSYTTDLYKIQVFAQRGYAVLRPNPRGSTGYGHAFRKAAIEDWGPGPFQDLMAGIDKTIEMGVAHPDSLAIMGWSYGGYMSAYAVTQTDRFEAAVMGAGIANLISEMGTTDILDWQAGQMGGEFWNRFKTYEENSPIYHVEGVTTPTLVLHGAEDERVHPTQGREFYRALRRLGVPTEMVLYPQAGHTPPEPKQQMDITPRIIDWFNEHLGRASSEDAPGEHSEGASSGQ